IEDEEFVFDGPLPEEEEEDDFASGPMSLPFDEPEEKPLDEWMGLSEPLGTRITEFRVYNKKNWKRTWRRLTEEKLPKVKFRKHMVVGVCAGKADRAERIEITDITTDVIGMVVKYRIHLRAKSAPTVLQYRVPYHLKKVPKTNLNIRFVGEDFKRTPEPEDIQKSPETKQ
ncbi:hypothetical protein ACFL2T_07655, partial [Elusimicrobiota bacterium]